MRGDAAAASAYLPGMNRTNLGAAFSSVLVGTGLAAQGFGAPIDVALPPTFVQAAAMAVGDTNEDGAPDLVVAEQGQYHVLLGNGLGGFPCATTYSFHPIDVVLVSRLHLLDWNDDGHLDLLVGHMQGASVLFGDGTGLFVDGPTMPDVRPNFAFADLNRDGRPDFVGLRISDQPVVVFGGAATVFGPKVPIGPSLLGGGLVTTGDVDRDGDVDVVVQNQFDGTITTLLGDGTGSFAAPLTSPPPPTFSLYESASLVDADGDQWLDVVSGAVGAGVATVRIAAGNGSGLFALPTLLPGPGKNPLAFADVTADGQLDLVATGDDAIVLYPGTANGAFADPLVTATAHDVLRLVLADLDRDGRVDVAAAGNVLQVCRNARPTPTGVVAYGTGTPACSGTIGMHGTPRPAIGEGSFRVLCSNAPPDSVGLLAVGTRVLGGWDPLGLGLELHLGLAFPVTAMRSDVGGVAGVALPIPNIPWFAGLTVHLQSFWIGDAGRGDTCSKATYELASSRGLSITLQP